MAFFDKINQMANYIGDKTSDAIETTKLAAKAHSEKSAAIDDYKKIGEYYYNQYMSGEIVAEEVVAFCESAKEHLEAAKKAQEEIDKLKEEQSIETIPAKFCTACGAKVSGEIRFCPQCGNKMSE